MQVDSRPSYADQCLEGRHILHEKFNLNPGSFKYYAKQLFDSLNVDAMPKEIKGYKFKCVYESDVSGISLEKVGQNDKEIVKLEFVKKDYVIGKIKDFANTFFGDANERESVEKYLLYKVVTGTVHRDLYDKCMKSPQDFILYPDEMCNLLDVRKLKAFLNDVENERFVSLETRNKEISELKSPSRDSEQLFHNELRDRDIPLLLQYLQNKDNKTADQIALIRDLRIINKAAASSSETIEGLPDDKFNVEVGYNVPDIENLTKKGIFKAISKEDFGDETINKQLKEIKRKLEEAYKIEEEVNNFFAKKDSLDCELGTAGVVKTSTQKEKMPSKKPTSEKESIKRPKKTLSFGQKILNGLKKLWQKLCCCFFRKQTVKEVY